MLRRPTHTSVHAAHSIAFFCNPNKETLVDCLPGCSSEDNPYRYKPITAFDYITMRLSGTIDQ